MKLILKILKLLAILIFTVSIVLFSASLLLQDKVADIILKSLNKNLTTKLDVGSFKLSFLRKFPNASLELKNVFVHSSSDFISSAFEGINTDTLLAARLVSVEFKITDILKGNYNIERIGARAGRINLFTDNAGFVNYNISIKSSKSGSDDLTLNLERINLSDIKVNYNNLKSKMVTNGQIKSGRLKFRISGSSIDFAAIAELQIDNFQLYNIKIRKTTMAELDLNLQSSKNSIIFRKGVLRIEDYDIGLEGSVTAGKIYDLKIASHNLDIADIRNFLPERYQNYVSEYNPSGTIFFNSKIKGLLSRTSDPHIEINCLLKEGQISYGKSDIAITNLSFTGFFSNGSENRPETSSVSINDLKLKLGSADYTGSFILSGFNDPSVGLLFKGKVFPGELKEFFNLQNITETGGSADLDIKLESKISHKETYSLNDIIDLKPKAEVVFNSLTIGFQNKKMTFEQVNGNLSISNSILAKNLKFNYEGQKIKVNGEFRNLPEWLSGRSVVMTAFGDVSFSRLKPEVFFKNVIPNDTSAKNKTSFVLPVNLMLDVDFNIDSLTYKSFSSSKITGTLNYKPRLITFKSLKMQSLDGLISGNGFIAQNVNRSFISRGSFNVNKIDVNKTFTTFHNFGQEFIKAENLSGSLSGTLSLLLPMDSLLNTQIKTLTAEGKYVIVNGTLINFDPVKQLSSYIELSELENISFEKMENDFFIRNNFLYIPQMDVRSSAVNLSVNGKHSFDNDYEYHVKMLLSDVLSKKRRKYKSNVTTFGAIEDDGLGRTSLLLKIEGKGEEVKVGYDIKAAGTELKNNIKSERQTLKGILNKEYGWFKNDTAAKQKPVEKKTRFRVTFDEIDTVKNQVKKK
jgi:hypothetical protein